MLQIITLLVAMLLLAPCELHAQARPSGRSIGTLLLSGDAREKELGLQAARQIGLQNAPSEVRLALIEALAREGRLHRQHYLAVHSDQNVAPLEDPEFLGRLSSAVAELQDPRSIPALSGALGSGFAVIRALASFGDEAALPVLAVVNSPESIPDAVNHGLIALRLIVEGAPMRPLQDGTLKKIRLTAAQRLSTGKGLSLTTLWWAIDLAGVLNDPDLRQSIESIATDWNDVVARGVTDPELIVQTQKRAADRLAGVPPLPRL